jgi:hypothetical protein
VNSRSASSPYAGVSSLIIAKHRENRYLSSMFPVPARVLVNFAQSGILNNENGDGNKTEHFCWAAFRRTLQARDVT